MIGGAICQPGAAPGAIFEWHMPCFVARRTYVHVLVGRQASSCPFHKVGCRRSKLRIARWQAASPCGTSWVCIARHYLGVSGLHRRCARAIALWRFGEQHRKGVAAAALYAGSRPSVCDYNANASARRAIDAVYGRCGGRQVSPNGSLKHLSGGAGSLAWQAVGALGKELATNIQSRIANPGAAIAKAPSMRQVEHTGGILRARRCKQHVGVWSRTLLLCRSIQLRLTSFLKARA